MDFSSFFDYERAGADSDPAPAAIFLGNLPEEDWTRLLAVAQRRKFAAGELLLRQGEHSRAFYIVASGRLEVFASGQDGDRHIYDIEPLSVFGEQAFLDGLARSASVRAHSDGELFIISLEAFDLLSARYPELARMALFDLGRILSLRLRELTELMLRTRR
ncbi:MAG: cyclic nucleotide-binding domain-containing protein [Proteobacteria bacterium]|nr:cyclic nucleotide-binding domain-containing protein [Pseudomonadota bacterium]